ncbi:MAG: adenylate/guanylate cyclase domain-containing protein [Pseudomonadota bacterium]
MTQFYLTPFSLSVLNVALMLMLLVAFLLRMPGKLPATRNLLTFLLGVNVVFVAFFYIFSSLDLEGVRVAWWALHSVVFFILFLIQFTYHYPRTLFTTEAQKVFRLSMVVSLLVYLFYLYHTTLIEPVFDPNGNLFVYLGTHEIGILVGIELLWVMVVLARQVKNLRQRAKTEDGDKLLVTCNQISAIKKLSLILISPVVLVALIILAYLDLASWGVVGHLLGTGLMVFVLLFTVVYLNNALEPSTLLVKMVGMSLGAILVLLGFSSAITLDVYHDTYLSLKQVEIERSHDKLSLGDYTTLPEDIAYIEHDDELLLARGIKATMLSGKIRDWQSGWQFRQLNGNDTDHYYIAYTIEIDGADYEIGYRYQDYRAYIHEMALPLLKIVIGAVLLVVIAFPLFFRLSLFRPLQRLLRGVDSIEQGNLDVVIPVSVRDEIGGLTQSFNSMASSVRVAREKLRTAYDYQLDLTEAYSRFVPKEILSTLNKQSILELGLGDNVRKEMTVLFSDIRSFTTISESMTPEEIFNFINSYLQNVGPIVRRHGGYIDKYIGDAVMALFPGGPDDALATAIDMQKQARQFNKQQQGTGQETVELRIGVGIHTGELMLGTIGEPQRMEGTVISDAVNLASRIEGLTKLYNAPILISFATYDKLQHPDNFDIRRLDRVRVKGKQQWVEIIEVLDGLNDSDRQQRLELRGNFNKAVEAFQQEKFTEALALFQDLKQRNEEDMAVEVYIERCEQFIELGIPSDWDGAVKL